jgi:hypothetical protein
MSLSHIIVVVFILITVAFVVWLEIDSRKNAKRKADAAAAPEDQNKGRVRIVPRGTILVFAIVNGSSAAT